MYFMKKGICIIMLLLGVLLFCACVENVIPPDIDPLPGEDNTLRSSVRITLPDEGVPLYNNASVKVENTDLPLYFVYVNNEHTWGPNPDGRTGCGVGYFSLEGKAEISVAVSGMTSCVVRPLSAGVTADVTDGKAVFTLKSAGNYCIEPDGDPEKAIFLFVTGHETDTETGAEEKVIRFSKGIHTEENDPYIVNGEVTLTSGTKVILEEGAVVRARFKADNASDITICGTGIIDGSCFVRNAVTGEVTVPLEFNYCSGVVFRDFSVLDPAGWCVNWYFCTDSQIDNIKIISSRSNGDGISLQSCKDIDVRNCFLRTWDDSLVVKNYPRWNDRNIEGETENITFSNCILWTDLAQSMEIGYETIGKLMRNITFSNITVLHNFHKPVMSIHNSNNADIENVVFDTITVEDASMGRGDAGSNAQLCEITVEFSSTWSTNHKTTALGSITGVRISNVTVLSGNAIIPVRVAGSRDMRSGYNASIHYVKDVVFENVWLGGKQLTSGYAYLSVNEYAEAEVIKGKEKVIASFDFVMDDEELAEYSDHAEVTVI